MTTMSAKLLIKYTHLVFFVLLAIQLNAQLGGRSTYSFLSLNTSPLIAGLGGENVALPAADLSQVYRNPALLNDTLQRQLSLNYSKYFAGIHYGYVAFSPTRTANANYSFGLQYINYGKFVEADERGFRYGTFSVAEYAFVLTRSQILGKYFRWGVSLKPVFSYFEQYQSFGMASDWGLTYEKAFFMAGMSVLNLGTQIKPYVESHFEPLPLNILLGVSQRLEHAPFRFSATFHNLQQWLVSYDLPDTDQILQIDGSLTAETKSFGQFADNLMRHTVFAAEILPTANFGIQLGYHYQRRQELKISSRPGLVGFSLGVRMHVARFSVSYSRSAYHLAGAANYFSITTNLSEFLP